MVLQCLIEETHIKEKSTESHGFTRTDEIYEEWEEPSWFKGKSEDFKKIAIALMNHGFLYCGKFNEFYGKDEIKPIAIGKNWVLFISSEQTFDVYSEEELFTLPST